MGLLNSEVQAKFRDSPLRFTQGFTSKDQSSANNYFMEEKNWVIKTGIFKAFYILCEGSHAQHDSNLFTNKKLAINVNLVTFKENHVSAHIVLSSH